MILNRDLNDVSKAAFVRAKLLKKSAVTSPLFGHGVCLFLVSNDHLLADSKRSNISFSITTSRSICVQISLHQITASLPKRIETIYAVVSLLHIFNRFLFQQHKLLVLQMIIVSIACVTSFLNYNSFDSLSY